jgi:hypothetical protein
VPLDLVPQEAADELVPDPEVCREFHITPMTLWRWDQDPELDFPPPIVIRRRKFRPRSLLEKFKARLLRAAIEQRRRKVAEVIRKVRPSARSLASEGCAVAEQQQQIIAASLPRKKARRSHQDAGNNRNREQ